MTENNGNGSKIRKALFNEVSLIASICALAIGVTLFIARPDAEMQQDIALIKQSIDTIENNHLVHIQDNLEKECIRNDKQDAQLNSIENSITKILTILEK